MFFRVSGLYNLDPLRLCGRFYKDYDLSIIIYRGSDFKILSGI